MDLAETLSRLEHQLRPLLHRLPPAMATRAFSLGRSFFMRRFSRSAPPARLRSAPLHIRSTALDREFSFPLWNAAGMFKNGEGYAVVARQGAGAYVAGTTTATPRGGNTMHGITWPAVAYPRSQAASNWMGLPNEGHAAVAAKLAQMQRINTCWVGASVSADQGVDEAVALATLVDGMRAYRDAGVDYIELNESCPNVPGHVAAASVLDASLRERLQFVASHFLKERQRSLPVVVKFSTDTMVHQIDELVRTLSALGFDGIILGNTSTQYDAVAAGIAPEERRTYSYFTSTFGGGISGRPLRDASLALCAEAMVAVRALGIERTFHVIRCGGIATAADVMQSMQAGVRLNQWYTGYFDAFAQHGHNVYARLAAELAELLTLKQ